MFRKLEQDRPTLLLDEVDALFGTKRSAESYEGLRAILNAGNRRGTTVPRMVGEGKSMRVQDFATFGPKVLMGIGELPATIADRSIPIRLERRARSEPVTRFRYREAEPAALPIREALEAHLAPHHRPAGARPPGHPAPARRPSIRWLGAAAGYRGRGRRPLAGTSPSGCHRPLRRPHGRHG